MIIKETILKKIDNPLSRTRIALALLVGEQTIAFQMRTNAPNGRLTKMDALQAISQEAGVGIEEILEKEPIKAEAQK